MSPRSERRWQMGVSALCVVAIAALCSFLAAQYAIDRSEQHADERAAVVLARVQAAKAKAAQVQAVARYTESLRACGRGNAFRTRVNTTVIRIEREFLKTARIARLAAANAETDPALRQLNAAAAVAYTTYIRDLKPVPLTDCHAAYHSPASGRS